MILRNGMWSKLFYLRNPSVDEVLEAETELEQQIKETIE